MRISDWSSDVCSSDLTRDRKRAEFQPVPAAAFMRFLFDWQGLVGSDKREGPAALELVLAQLEGFPVAASAWESEILPVRKHWYEAHWLDQLRSDEHTSELQSLMSNSYAVFCLTKK